MLKTLLRSSSGSIVDPAHVTTVAHQECHRQSQKASKAGQRQHPQLVPEIFQRNFIIRDVRV